MVTLKGEDRSRCAHAITWDDISGLGKMHSRDETNAPNQLNEFDRATVNRPLMRARLGACRGG